MVVADLTQDLSVVTGRLHAALDEHAGKLRVTDAIALAGFDRWSRPRAILVGLAMRQLGWERGRHRFDGKRVESVYVRGSFLEREVVLDVERGTDGQCVVVSRSPDDRAGSSRA